MSRVKGLLQKKITLQDMKTLAHTIEKISAMLKISKCRSKKFHVKYQSSCTHCSKVISHVKVFKKRSNSKAKVTGSKMLAPTENSCPKKYSCETYQSSSTHCSKVIIKVKVSGRISTLQNENKMPPDLRSRGH